APSRDHPTAARRHRKPHLLPQSLMAARELDPQERLDWLRLTRTETVGPVTFYALLRRFGSARAALDALPRLSRPVAAMSRRDARSGVGWAEPPRRLSGVLGRTGLPGDAGRGRGRAAGVDRARQSRAAAN